MPDSYCEEVDQPRRTRTARQAAARACLNAPDTSVGVPRLIEGRVDEYSYAYNPRGPAGVVVLTGAAKDILHATQSARTVRDVLERTSGALVPELVATTLIELAHLRLVELSDHVAMRQPSRSRQVEIWLQMTDACNLSCGYCFIKKTPHWMSVEVAKRIVSRIVASCAAADVDEVLFKIAGGEPLLRWKETQELLTWSEAYADHSSPRVRWHLITNGTRLPDGFVDLVRARNVGVSVSLDGVYEWHDVHRSYVGSGRGSFADVNRNIEYLLTCGIRPFILATVTLQNAPGLIDLASYCNDRRLSFRFSLVRLPSQSPEAREATNSHLAAHLCDCYLWMESHLPSTSLYDTHRFCDVNLRRTRSRNCGVGINGLTIATDGSAAICQYAMAEPIGNALDDDALALLAHQRQYDPDDADVDRIDGCCECEWRYTCANGCPYAVKEEFGTFRHRSPYCTVFKNVLPALVRLHAVQTISQYKSRRGGLKNDRRYDS